MLDNCKPKLMLPPQLLRLKLRDWLERLQQPPKPPPQLQLIKLLLTLDLLQLELLRPFMKIQRLI